MMGGAHLFIKGDGMVPDPPSNYPQYTIDGFSSTAFAGENVNDDDSYYSSTLNGRLAVRTPSLLTMLNANWVDFNGLSSLPSGNDANPIYLQTEIATAVYSSPALGCATNNACRLKYKRDYTPHLHDVVPH